MTTSQSGYAMPVTFSQFQGGVYRNKPSSYSSRYQGRHIISPRAGVNLGVLVFRRVAGKYVYELLYEQDRVTPQAYQLPCFSPPGNGKKIYPYLLRKLRSLLGQEFIGLAPLHFDPLVPLIETYWYAALLQRNQGNTINFDLHTFKFLRPNQLNTPNVIVLQGLSHISALFASNLIETPRINYNPYADKPLGFRPYQTVADLLGDNEAYYSDDRPDFNYVKNKGFKQ